MKKLFCYSILFITTININAQSTLQNKLNDWANDPYLAHASVGVSIAEVETGREIASYESQRSLIPASNLKVLTTASALAMLGAGFRFQTRLAYSGSIDAQGNLHGDVFILGSGDPTLGSPEMEGTPSMTDVLTAFRGAIQQKGIRKIMGRIIADDRIFSSAATGSNWQWLDLGNYYGCGAFGLNVHDNLFYLRFQQKSTLGSTPPVAQISPTIPNLQIHNEIKSAESGSGDNAYIYGAPYSYQRHLRGTIPVGSSRFTIKGAIPNPPLFTAQQLTNSLEEIGILCMRPPASARDLEDLSNPQETIYIHQSPSLAAIVKRTNMKSVNMYSEVLLRTIGKEVNGDGTAEAGLAAIKTFWEDRGMNFSGVQLYDGSGMAPRNVLTARFFTLLLSKMQKTPVAKAFMESLPLAGRSGSLRNGLKGTCVEGRLRAKSGSLEQVRAYTGYVPDSSGRLLAFSILLNNYDGSGGDARRKLYALMSDFCE